LVLTEQGVGDIIQFIRYVAHVKALGATVIVLLRKPVRELVEGLDYVDRVIELGDPVPAFDYYIHLMSLPTAFATELATIPSRVPYLLAAGPRRNGGRRIVRRVSGILWTNDRPNL
jgi:hypothetical protein